MLQIYGPNNNALNQPAYALRAEQIVINNKPTPTYTDYQTLALFAFLAHNTREGDLAAARAIDLAPAADRAQLRTELKALKANPNALSQAASPANTGPQTFSIPSTTPSGASTASGAATSAAPAVKKKG